MTSPKRLFTLTNSHLSQIDAAHGQVAQLVEQRTENPRVGGSTPSLATNIFNEFRAAVTAALLSFVQAEVFFN